MDPHIFKTDTNLTDVDTVNFFEEAFLKGNAVDTYIPDSATLFPLWFIIIGFLFVAGLLLIAAVVTKAISKESDNPEPKETGLAILAFAGMVAFFVFSTILGPGPEGKFGVESVLAYEDKDRASVKDIQGSWIYKNHDFVQKNVKSSNYLKDYDIHCEDEMKIPEQEKRSVLCGGDILSPVSAKDKDFNFDYWLLPDFRIDYGKWDDPRVAKIKEQEKDKENPIKLSLIVEKERV